MVIKSNNNNFIKELLKNKTLIRSLFMGLVFTGSFFLWDFSGLLSAFLTAVGLIVLSPLNEIDKLGATFLTIVIVIGLGSFDTYFIDKPNKVLQVKKIDFTDSTEKIIIYTDDMPYVLSPKAVDYYYFKANRDENLSVYLSFQDVNYHWAKIIGKAPHRTIKRICISHKKVKYCEKIK